VLDIAQALLGERGGGDLDQLARTGAAVAATLTRPGAVAVDGSPTAAVALATSSAQRVATRWLARNAAGGGSDLERAGHPLGGDRGGRLSATRARAGRGRRELKAAHVRRATRPTRQSVTLRAIGSITGYFRSSVGARAISGGEL
jgi:hypothetical protein